MDSRRAYIRQQLFTGCVRAAQPSNIRSMLERLGNPMGVHIIASSGAVTVDFRLRGEMVRAPELDMQGVPVVWEGVGVWRAINQASKGHLVRVSLYRLCLFMSKGYQQLHRPPLLDSPWDEASCVVHYCECRPTGVCCAPWHMDFGSKRENAARGGESRKRRGKHKSRQLVTADIKVALGRPAPG